MPDCLHPRSGMGNPTGKPAESDEDEGKDGGDTDDFEEDSKIRGQNRDNISVESSRTDSGDECSCFHRFIPF